MFRNKYSALWLLLAVSLLIIVIISFVEDINIGSYTLKKSPIAENLLAERVDNDSTIRSDSIKVIEEKVETDSLPQIILVFGDSMSHNLGLRLAQYAKHNGHEIHTVNWDSSNTKIWADYDTLQYYINQYHPTQIFVSLGSNEVLLPKPDLRRPQIKKILSVIGDIPYVWIGPPNWREDTGINAVIASECKPGTFFLSDGMEFERGPDKIHPTRKSSALWMDSVIRWLPKTPHPFRADLPPDSIGDVSSHVIFLKALNK